MMQGTSNLPILAWLTLFAASLGCTALYALCALLRNRLAVRWMARTSAWATVVIAVTVAADFIVRQSIAAPPLNAFRLAVAALIATVALSWHHLRVARRVFGQSDVLRSPAAWIALLTSMGLCLGSGWQFRDRSQQSPGNGGILLHVPGGRQVVENWVGFTDRGRMLTLYEWPLDSSGLQDYEAKLEYQRLLNFPSIRREQAHEQTNCHGWVFTKGRYLLFGPEVELILKDNGYQPVDQPEINDVIVYRGNDGTISHSGLVQAILADGSPIIESKWGIGPRCLHFPLDQPFGSNFSYYRSQRGQHAICVYRSPGSIVGGMVPGLRRMHTLRSGSAAKRSSEISSSDTMSVDLETE